MRKKLLNRLKENFSPPPKMIVSLVDDEILLLISNNSDHLSTYRWIRLGIKPLLLGKTVCIKWGIINAYFLNRVYTQADNIIN